jgi:hypothetical protein
LVENRIAPTPRIEIRVTWRVDYEQALDAIPLEW